MKRNNPLRRKTPLRANPETTRAWKNRTAKALPKGEKPMKQRSSKRAKQEQSYSSARLRFLQLHPVCPVTGEKTTQIHHSAKRVGKWLNWQRYWIAVSAEGHRWIEDHKKKAEKYGLMVRINKTYDEHLKEVLTRLNYRLALLLPVFYSFDPDLPLVNESGNPINV